MNAHNVPYSDTLSIRDWTVLNVGDVVYENDAGQSVKMVILTKPTKHRDGDAERVSFTADVGGHKMEMLCTVGAMHYGPHLSRQPQYNVVTLSDYLDDVEGN